MKLLTYFLSQNEIFWIQQRNEKKTKKKNGTQNELISKRSSTIPCENTLESQFLTNVKTSQPIYNISCMSRF